MESSALEQLLEKTNERLEKLIDIQQETLTHLHKVAQTPVYTIGIGSMLEILNAPKDFWKAEFYQDVAQSFMNISNKLEKRTPEQEAEAQKKADLIKKSGNYKKPQTIILPPTAKA